MDSSLTQITLIVKWRMDERQATTTGSYLCTPRTEGRDLSLVCFTAGITHPEHSFPAWVWSGRPTHTVPTSHTQVSVVLT